MGSLQIGKGIVAVTFGKNITVNIYLKHNQNCLKCASVSLIFGQN